jgi:hypothetical protein
MLNYDAIANEIVTLMRSKNMTVIRKNDIRAHYKISPPNASVLWVHLNELGCRVGWLDIFVPEAEEKPLKT